MVQGLIPCSWIDCISTSVPPVANKEIFMVKKFFLTKTILWPRIFLFSTGLTFWLLSKPVPSPQHLCVCPCCSSHLFILWRSWSFQQKTEVQPKNCGLPKIWRPRSLHWPLRRATCSPGRRQAWWNVSIQEHPITTEGSSRDEVLHTGFPNWQQSPLAHKSRLRKPTPFHWRRIPIQS